MSNSVIIITFTDQGTAETSYLCKSCYQEQTRDRTKKQTSKFYIVPPPSATPTLQQASPKISQTLNNSHTNHSMEVDCGLIVPVFVPQHNNYHGPALLSASGLKQLQSQVMDRKIGPSGHGLVKDTRYNLTKNCLILILTFVSISIGMAKLQFISSSSSSRPQWLDFNKPLPFRSQSQ